MKDRVPTYPGRVKLTPVAGQENTYDMVRADEPKQEGTPLNKNSLLTDETAELIGLQDATVNEALAKLGELMNDARGRLGATEYKVGDTLTTVRTDLGDKWLPCDGSQIIQKECPELFGMTAVDLSWHQIRGLTIAPRATPVWDKPDNLIFLGKGTAKSNAYLYSRSAGALTAINVPDGYYIIGIDWNGAQWVACTVPLTETGVAADSDAVTIYTSDNLSAWTHAAEVPMGVTIDADSTSYCMPRFLFDGVIYRLLALHSGYANPYLFAMDSAFSLVGSEVLPQSDNAEDYYCYMLTRSENGICTLAPRFTGAGRLYAQGDTSYFVAHDFGYGCCGAMHKYDDGRYLVIPIGQTNVVLSYELFVYSVYDNAISEINLRTIEGDIGSLVFVSYDVSSGEYMLYCTSVSDGLYHYILRLPDGTDPLTASNYTMEKCSGAAPLNAADLYAEPTSDLCYIYEANKQVSDPIYNRYLPAMSIAAGTVTYIKAKE